jgi:hypothetical protein
MKRQSFRLGAVLRYYELQKHRAEYEFHQATQVLREIDLEITCLSDELVRVAEVMKSKMDALSAAGWIACYRKSEHVGKRLAAERMRRSEQAKLVAALQDKRKRWAIAEETLLSLKHNAAAFNHAEAEKHVQTQLDETVLRQWISKARDLHS